MNEHDRWQAGIFALFYALSFTTVSFREFEKATADFDQAAVDGPTVVTDLFPCDDLVYPQVGKYVYEKKYRSQKASLLAHDCDPKKNRRMMSRLRDFVDDHAPLGKLDEFGHGLPGSTDDIWWNADAFVDETHRDGRPFAPSDLFAPGARVSSK